MPKSESRNSEPLTNTEIKTYQDIVARLGLRKTSGFLYLLEKKEGSQYGNKTKYQGLVFGNDINNDDMLLELIWHLYEDSLQKMAFVRKLIIKIQNSRIKDEE